MSSRSLITGDAPEVLIDTVYGDLQLAGWERAEILLKSNTDETDVLEQEGPIVHIQTTGDCLLQLPHHSKLTVINVHGGAQIKRIASLVTFRRILGSLALDDVGSGRVESVFGEFIARNIAGDLTIDHILGNTWVEGVKGDCSLESIAGDLVLDNAGGNVQVSARGDAQVRLETLAGSSYKIEASGDITFTGPAETDARIQIFSRSNEITLNLPDGKRRLAARSHDLTLGMGTASILLSASGSVSIRCGEGGAPGKQAQGEASANSYQEITDDGESQIETQLGIIEERMAHTSGSFDRAGVTPVEADRITRRIQESGERVNLRAQEKMQSARDKLDRKLAAATRKVEEREKTTSQRRENQERRTWSSEWAATSTRSQREPEVSDEERLVILRMLEQKKISLAEAERLFDALEGKSE